MNAATAKVLLDEFIHFRLFIRCEGVDLTV